MSYLDDLKTARANTAAELAALDATKAGGKPDHSASGVGHVAYYNSRLAALKTLDELIEKAEQDTEAGGTGGPVEIISEVE